MFPLQRQSLDERFADTLTPEEVGWSQLYNGPTTRPQQAQQPVASSTTTIGQLSRTVPASQQIRRVNVGQQLLPVDDHDNYDNYDHDKADDPHDAALERVHQGKQPDPQTTCPLWSNDL